MYKYQYVKNWSTYLTIGNRNDQLEALQIPSTSQQFRGSDVNNASSNEKELIKAKISLSIAIGFIVCHSFKWITNILEIRMVMPYGVIFFVFLCQDKVAASGSN